jgi:hypothetical protein
MEMINISGNDSKITGDSLSVYGKYTVSSAISKDIVSVSYYFSYMTLRLVRP